MMQLILNILRGRAENLFMKCFVVLSSRASDGSFLHLWWKFIDIISTLLIIILVLDSACIDHFIVLQWYLQWIKPSNRSTCSPITGPHFCFTYITIISFDQFLDHSHFPPGPGWIIMYKDHIPYLNRLRSICTLHFIKFPESCQILNPVSSESENVE